MNIGFSFTSKSLLRYMNQPRNAIASRIIHPKEKCEPLPNTQPSIVIKRCRPETFRRISKDTPNIMFKK